MEKGGGWGAGSPETQKRRGQVKGLEREGQRPREGVENQRKGEKQKTEQEGSTPPFAAPALAPIASQVGPEASHLLSLLTRVPGLRSRASRAFLLRGSDGIPT